MKKINPLAPIKKVVSFGDSFTAGLGTDYEYEESQLGNHPKWKEFTENEKNEARTRINTFRAENSFTKFFADKFQVPYTNWGSIGSNNKYILNKIFEEDLQCNGNYNGEFYLISFTSSLRDDLPFFPSMFNDNRRFGLSTSIKELILQVKNPSSIWFNSDLDNKYEEQLDSFLGVYIPKYLTKYYDEKYYEVFNIGLISFIQEFLKFRGINYIMIDAFEPMLKNNSRGLDIEKYWEFSNKNIFSYLGEFNDADLYQKSKGGKWRELASPHPSKKGHELFAKELYRFYNEVY